MVGDSLKADIEGALAAGHARRAAPPLGRACRPIAAGGRQVIRTLHDLLPLV